MPILTHQQTVTAVVNGLGNIHARHIIAGANGSTLTIEQISWTGVIQSRDVTSSTWSSPAPRTVYAFSGHTFTIYTMPATLPDQVLMSNTAVVHPWSTTARVPLSGTATATNFASPLQPFPDWVQFRRTGRIGDNLTFQASLTDAAPFGTYLKGLVARQATGNAINVTYTEVGHRTRNLTITMPAANWLQAITGTSAWRMHFFYGTYRHNANDIAPTRPVTLYLHGGNISGNPTNPIQHIVDGAPAIRPIPDPQRSGFEFLRWSNVENGVTAWNFATPIVANNTINATNTLHAVWIQLHVVTFNLHGGEIAENPVNPTVSVRTGTPVAAPVPNPQRLGHQFLRWSATPNGAVAWNFATNITAANTINATNTLHAVWQELPWREIVFRIGNPLNDTSMSWVLHEQDNTIINLANMRPQHVSLEFMGWANTGERARNLQIDLTPNATFTVTSSRVLYAVWNIDWNSVAPGIHGHNIMTLNFGGGVNPETSPPNQSRQYWSWDPTSRLLPSDAEMATFATINTNFDGLEFNGWFDNPNLTGNRVHIIPEHTRGEVQFFARWVPII